MGFRPITLINTELNLLTKIVGSFAVSCLHSVGAEQTCSVKKRIIQSNMHLIRTLLEEVEIDDETVLINLDQSNRIDHQYF